MLTRSLGNLERQDFGFRTDGLMSVSLNPPPSWYSQARLDALYRDLQERLQRVPGVERASLARLVEMRPRRGGDQIEGAAPVRFIEQTLADECLGDRSGVAA